jgi:hypothetical protein
MPKLQIKQTTFVMLEISKACFMCLKRAQTYTANVYRDLRGVYREIRVRGFQIYGDCMLPTIPVILKSPYSDFHCNICRDFDFTGILWGYPTSDVGKSCIIYSGVPNKRGALITV